MHSRRHVLWMVIWFVIYAVLLTASIKLLDHRVITGLPWRVVVALVPMIPACGILVTTMRTYRESDEFQKKIVAEAIMFAFGATAIITFSYGFLQRFVGAPDVSYFYVWSIMGGAWVVGSALARYRYR
jgi:hypothetical protein